MNKFSKNIAIILLSSVGMVGFVQAQTCATPPSCAALGYDKSTSDCNGQAMLRCPFDQAKVFCSETIPSGGVGDDESGTGNTCNGLCAMINGTMYKFKDLNRVCNSEEFCNSRLLECQELTDNGKTWLPIIGVDIARMFSLLHSEVSVCFFDISPTGGAINKVSFRSTVSSNIINCQVGCVTTY